MILPPFRRTALVLVVSLVSGVTSSVLPSFDRNQNPMRSAKMEPQVFRGGAYQPSEDSHMPCLFSEEECDYDRYAACLAATEGLRRIRDEEMATLVEEKRKEKLDSMEDAERLINMKYAQKSAQVLRQMGMPVEKFNALGRAIAKDATLKKKVKEQAYLYRMAATVNMRRVALVEEESPNKFEVLDSVPKDKVERFSESLAEIEDLRASQLERLVKSLKVDSFPEHIHISDPKLLPFLSPRVRAVVEAFPLQAEEIVKKHGLEADEFNKMLEETKHNSIFRWKIQKLVKKADEPEEEAVTKKA